MPAPTTWVTQDDLAAHATADACWTVIGGVVYDITTIVAAHPGGSVITLACGKDATVLYETRPMGSKTPHSETARYLLAPLRVGPLADGPAPMATAEARAGEGAGGAAEGSHVERTYATLPRAARASAKDVNLRIAHALGADNNVLIGVERGFKHGTEVGLTHATGTTESDLYVRTIADSDTHSLKPAGGLELGVGGRFTHVADDERVGVYGVALASLDPLGPITLGGAAAVASLPSAGRVTVGAGLGVQVRPSSHASLVGDVRWVDLTGGADLQWSAGLRGYSARHSFTLGVQSAPALGPLEVWAPSAQAARGMAGTLELTRLF